MQIYAQRLGIELPRYEMIKEGPMHRPCFRSIVWFGNGNFITRTHFFNKKAAEEEAARLALSSFQFQVQVQAIPYERPLHNFLYKNMLQEYCHKRGIQLPLYQTWSEGQQHETRFRSAVSVAGNIYTSQCVFSKKKLAEQEAARLALLGLDIQL